MLPQEESILVTPSTPKMRNVCMCFIQVGPKLLVISQHMLSICSCECQYVCINCSYLFINRFDTIDIIPVIYTSILWIFLSNCIVGFYFKTVIISLYHTRKLAIRFDWILIEDCNFYVSLIHYVIFIL